MAVFENKYCKSLLKLSVKLVVCTNIIKGKYHQTLLKSVLLQLQLSLKQPQESRHPTANDVYATETNIPHIIWKQ